MADILHVGDVAQLETTFSVNGIPIGPTTVTVAVVDPAGAELDPAPSVTNPGVGVYEAAVTVDAAGVWRYRWEGSGAVVGVDEGTFYVYHSLTAPRPGLCTLEEVRATLSDPPDRSGDQLLQRLIDDVTHAMSRAGGRDFLPIAGGPHTFTFRYKGRGFLALHPHDLREIDSLTIAGTASTDYELEPTPSQTGTYTWVRLPLGERADVTITGEWGMAEVPGDVRQAAIVQLREWYTRDVARFSEAFTDAEGPIALPNRALSRHAFDVASSYRMGLVA